MKITDRTYPPKAAPPISTPTPVPQPQPRIAWEYRVVKMDLDAELMQYGQEGWELVAVVPVPFDPSQALYHFKRRRQ